jgi:hypothetical protein
MMDIEELWKKAMLDSGISTNGSGPYRSVVKKFAVLVSNKQRSIDADRLYRMCDFVMMGNGPCGSCPSCRNAEIVLGKREDLGFI